MATDEDQQAHIVVAYHSANGHTAAIAEAVREGAEEVDGVSAELIDVTLNDTPWRDLAAADAIVFGCPTHFGNVSAEMKAFQDASLDLWKDMQWRDKIAAGFTCSGAPSGDKQSVLLALSIFAAQHGMIWIGMDPMKDVRTGDTKPEGYNRLGSNLGLMSNLESGSASPPQADSASARVFGRRIGRTTRRFIVRRESR